MDKLASQISSEADLKAHIVSYPELYEDLAVDVLEERLEMDCTINLYPSECDAEGCETHYPCNINDCDGYEECSEHAETEP